MVDGAVDVAGGGTVVKAEVVDAEVNGDCAEVVVPSNARSPDVPQADPINVTTTSIAIDTAREERLVGIFMEFS